MDVLKYEPVIQKVLKYLGVKAYERDDLIQESYVALLEKEVQTEIEAEEIIRQAAFRWLARQRKDKADSLDCPRTYHKAEKLAMPDEGITEQQLQDALIKMPYQDYVVMYSLFVEGKTQEKTAADLGLTRKIVRRIKDNGVKQLRRYFEVEDGN